VSTAPAFRWQFNAVTGTTDGDDARLTHDLGAELLVRAGRLRRGAGYAEAPTHARIELARAGAILRLRRRGRYHVHASAVVDRHGRAWLFTGVSGSGKSTLAYALARRGWRVLGDDGVIIEPEAAVGPTILAYAWRESLWVSAALASDFPELAMVDTLPLPGDPRARVPVVMPWARVAPVAAVIMLRQGADDAVERISAVESLAELVRQSAWVLIPDGSARQHLDGLKRLVEAVPSYRITHSPRQLQEIEATIDALGV